MSPPTADVIQEAVNQALERLKAEDAHLFTVNVSERSLTFRLGLYLQCEFPDWRVDCEYNRNGDYPKRLSGVEHQRRFEDPTSKTKGEVYPDIIVHSRGPNGPNLLAIEAKKESDLTNEDKERDLLKLRCYREQFAYQAVAFIVFRTGAHGPYCTAEFDIGNAPSA